MPFLIGMLIGRKVNGVVFSRLVGVLAIWLAIPLLAYWFATVWIADEAGPVVAVAATGLAFAWALARPARSPLKLTMLDGVLTWCRVLIVIAAARTLFRVIGGGLSSRALESEGFWLAFGLLAFVISRCVLYWVRRDAAATSIVPG